MRELDEQERRIVRELVRNPRISDNKIGKRTKVPIRTVSRKRNKLEKEGMLSYFTKLAMGKGGTGRFGARQLHIIKFRLGILREQIIREIREEKVIKSNYGEYIHESFLGEVDGHVALLVIIDGHSDEDIVENFNREIIPILLKNHGEDSIKSVSTIRLSNTIRLFHNYIPMINMENGVLKNDWPDELIFLD